MIQSPAGQRTVALKIGFVHGLSLQVKIKMPASSVCQLPADIREMGTFLSRLFLGDRLNRANRRTGTA
jgi:hypothetical protein